jgi:hypothetical protein
VAAIMPFVHLIVHPPLMRESRRDRQANARWARAARAQP